MINLDFLFQYFRHPLQMGTFTESSKSLVEAVVEEMKGKTIVELGAGRGPVTKGILSKLGEDGRLVSFEINPKLYEQLAMITDNRFTPVYDSAENFESYIKGADCIISGLPLTSLKGALRERVLTICKKYPLFIQYKYANSTKLLEQYFDNIRLIKVMKNIPPAVVYVCTNDGGGL